MCKFHCPGLYCSRFSVTRLVSYGPDVDEDEGESDEDSDFSEENEDEGSEAIIVDVSGELSF